MCIIILHPYLYYLNNFNQNYIILLQSDGDTVNHNFIPVIRTPP